jgi:hypothetical protein
MGHSNNTWHSKGGGFDKVLLHTFFKEILEVKTLFESKLKLPKGAFFLIHSTAYIKLGLKISDQKKRNVTRRGGRKSAKKVYSIIWLAPKW